MNDIRLRKGRWRIRGGGRRCARIGPMSDYGQRSEDRNQGYGRGDRAGRGGGPRRYDGAGREGRGDRGYR